jgi:hypothetical protein
VTFVELPQFTDAIVELVDDECFAVFQKSLLINAKAGKIIRNSGGLRKIRMRLPGRGKSGGARVIYMHVEAVQTVILFYVYTKAKADDLTAQQLARLRAAAAIIRKEFNK